MEWGRVASWEELRGVSLTVLASLLREEPAQGYYLWTM